MNAKTIKIIIAVVLLAAAALLLFRFVSGGSPAVGPNGEKTNPIDAGTNPNPPPADENAP